MSDPELPKGVPNEEAGGVESLWPWDQAKIHDEMDEHEPSPPSYELREIIQVGAGRALHTFEPFIENAGNYLAIICGAKLHSFVIRNDRDPSKLDSR
jgi:hypothetical protein